MLLSADDGDEVRGEGENNDGQTVCDVVWVKVDRLGEVSAVE